MNVLKFIGSEVEWVPPTKMWEGLAACAKLLRCLSANVGGTSVSPISGRLWLSDFASDILVATSSV